MPKPRYSLSLCRGGRYGRRSRVERASEAKLSVLGTNAKRAKRSVSRSGHGARAKRKEPAEARGVYIDRENGWVRAVDSQGRMAAFVEVDVETQDIDEVARRTEEDLDRFDDGPEPGIYDLPGTLRGYRTLIAYNGDGDGQIAQVGLHGSYSEARDKLRRWLGSCGVEVAK